MKIRDRYFPMTVWKLKGLAQSDFFGEGELFKLFQFTVPDRIIEKNGWENARATRNWEKNIQNGLLVPGYFPMPG